VGTGGAVTKPNRPANEHKGQRVDHARRRADTLSATELQLYRESLTRTPVARPVKARVHYGAVPCRAVAVAD
jgi:hypothetical protein